MSYDTLVRDIFETLPSEEQVEVIDFMLFLKKRKEKQSLGVKNTDHIFLSTVSQGDWAIFQMTLMNRLRNTDHSSIV